MAVASTALPNSDAAIRARVAAGLVGHRKPLLMLASRFVLFALWQAAIALIYALRGNPDPWDASIAWWPVTAILTNVVSIALLVVLSRQEGMTLRDLYRVEKHSIGREVLFCLAFLVVAAPVMMIPNIALGTWLFGDMQKVSELFYRPLPLWAIVPAVVLFPITIALSELPTYYAYAMPRLAALASNGWGVVLLAALWHGAQHMALPLVFDGRFLLYRFGMLAPFALLVAAGLYKRPRLLPYLMVAHALLDATLPLTILSLSK